MDYSPQGHREHDDQHQHFPSFTFITLTGSAGIPSLQSVTLTWLLYRMNDCACHLMGEILFYFSCKRIWSIWTLA